MEQPPLSRIIRSAASVNSTAQQIELIAPVNAPITNTSAYALDLVIPNQVNVTATTTSLKTAVAVNTYQANATATVLGVTNVNAYLNQINCLASVSEESQTTIAIPQQTYITATCGSLFANNIQITPVQALATAGRGTVYGNVQVTSPITNATASVRSLIAFGISQANATVSVSAVTTTTYGGCYQCYSRHY